MVDAAELVLVLVDHHLVVHCSVAPAFRCNLAAGHFMRRTGLRTVVLAQLRLQELAVKGLALLLLCLLLMLLLLALLFMLLDAFVVFLARGIGLIGFHLVVNRIWQALFDRRLARLNLRLLAQRRRILGLLRIFDVFGQEVLHLQVLLLLDRVP